MLGRNVQFSRFQILKIFNFILMGLAYKSAFDPIIIIIIASVLVGPHYMYMYFVYTGTMFLRSMIIVAL